MVSLPTIPVRRPCVCPFFLKKKNKASFDLQKIAAPHGRRFFPVVGVPSVARATSNFKRREFFLQPDMRGRPLKKKESLQKHKEKITTAPPLSLVFFAVDREGKGRRAAMSQAESAPLGSVAAKVEVVGSGVGWCAPLGPLFFPFFFFRKKGTGMCTARTKEVAAAAGVETSLDIGP